MVCFFVALIKHDIRMKCKKCIMGVSYFLVCFAKTFAIPMKYEKCIASLTNNIMFAILTDNIFKLWDLSLAKSALYLSDETTASIASP